VRRVGRCSAGLRRSRGRMLGRQATGQLRPARWRRRHPTSPGRQAITSLKSPLALAHWFLQHGARLVVTYQPDSRFWPFQWTETAWLAAVSGLLLAAACALAPDRRSQPRAPALVLYRVGRHRVEGSVSFAREPGAVGVSGAAVRL
jgi:hypothetical protein